MFLITHSVYFPLPNDSRWETMGKWSDLDAQDVLREQMMLISRSIGLVSPKSNWFNLGRYSVSDLFSWEKLTRASHIISIIALRYKDFWRTCKHIHSWIFLLVYVKTKSTSWAKVKWFPTKPASIWSGMPEFIYFFLFLF